MQRKTHLEIGIERLKRSRIFLFVDRIEPNALGQWLRFKDWGVMGGIHGAETGRERADALLAIHLQIEDTNRERVAGLRAVDIKRSS